MIKGAGAGTDFAFSQIWIRNQSCILLKNYCRTWARAK